MPNPVLNAFNIDGELKHQLCNPTPIDLPETHPIMRWAAIGRQLLGCPEIPAPPTREGT